MNKTTAEKMAFLKSATDEELREIVINDPDMIREIAKAGMNLIEAGKPFANKCAKWEASHVPVGKYPYRDTTQITHKLGDFRTIRREISVITEGNLIL